METTTRSINTLIVDIGNTMVKATVFCNGNIVSTAHFLHDETEELSNFLSKTNVSNAAFAAVGDVSEDIATALTTVPVQMKKVTVNDIPMDLITNGYSTPQTLGIDRIAAVIGAMSLSPKSDILVVDAGTCITYDILTANKEYIGGNISPGIDMRLKAMNAFTAKLPLVAAEGDTPEIGNSTETAIRSGVIHGISREIEGTINHFRLKFPNLKVYLTGGSMKLLCISNKNHTFADDFLVERGIYLIFTTTNSK